MQLGIPQTHWRKCGDDEPNHFHIFRDCLAIKSFWKDVGDRIQQDSEVTNTTDFSCFVFGGTFLQEVTGSDILNQNIYSSREEGNYTQMVARESSICRKLASNGLRNLL